MPGGTRWDPVKEPFSYAKVCFYYLPALAVLFCMVALLISMFGGFRWFWLWLDGVGGWLPSSKLLRAAMGAVFVL